jgi:hypothetical protein
LPTRDTFYSVYESCLPFLGPVHDIYTEPWTSRLAMYMIRPLVIMIGQSRDVELSLCKVSKHLGLFVDLSTNACGLNNTFV